MEMQWLRYFLAAADAGSVSRGAERMRVAQPSMSTQIRKLEGHLGLPLFDRVAGGVVLTEAGRAFYPRARRILGAVREAEEQLKRDVESGNGMLSVGAIPTIAPFVLPATLQALRAEFPECTITVREDLTERLAEAIVDNEIDCAVISPPFGHELLDVEVVGEEELVACVPRGHPSARGKRRFRAADMSGQPTVTLEEMHCLGRQIQGFSVARRLRPSIVCRTTQLATILEMVGSGVGISIVPAMAAATHADGSCQFVRFAGEPPTRQLGIAWRRDRSRSMLARRFVELIAARCS
ncbi:MAG TPA: LysR family transcriptional regulator [Gemmatimonadaceae bacterium]|jgi:LysR family hydrogen peroxide-inducible transcriptional activator|nr:LysR family transcriptional regulator [Gemmatimonadaceae bacterium]